MNAVSGSTTADDGAYAFDEAKVETFRKEKAWLADPRYFRAIRISAVAAVKMAVHAHSGCEKGVKAGGKPIEVMGLMLGRPDVDHPHMLLVTDVFPLPIEGFETRVLADDDEISNYMIALSESLAKTRQERFMGWYHSHPFDVDVRSHCFMSGTDVSTQLGWQMLEDRRGNPFVAIVIDPLRSSFKGIPEMGAFRAFPPSFNGDSLAPDMKPVVDEEDVISRWGAVYSRYYQLEIQYVLSELSAAHLGLLSRRFLWSKALCSTPMMEIENRQRLAERIGSVADKLESSKLGGSEMGMSRMPGVADRLRKRKEGAELGEGTEIGCGIAVEHCCGHMCQLAKRLLFVMQQRSITVPDVATSEEKELAVACQDEDDRMDDN